MHGQPHIRFRFLCFRVAFSRHSGKFPPVYKILIKRKVKFVGPNYISNVHAPSFMVEPFLGAFTYKRKAPLSCPFCSHVSARLPPGGFL